MTKKSFLVLLLAVIMAGSVFAQERKNFISGEVSILGVGVRYEHMLSPTMSIGGNLYYNTFFLMWNDFGADFTFRIYGGKIFYFGISAGFHQQYSWLGDLFSGGRFGNVLGFAVTPEVGWKIDVGSPGGFFISPGMKLPITLGVSRYDYWDFYTGRYQRNFAWGISFIGYIGLGYCW